MNVLTNRFPLERPLALGVHRHAIDFRQDIGVDREGHWEGHSIPPAQQARNEIKFKHRVAAM
jgi:hypothetical protein